jgi:hypothetical protein
VFRVSLLATPVISRVLVHSGGARFSKFHLADGRNVLLDPHVSVKRPVRFFEQFDFSYREILVLNILLDACLDFRHIPICKPRATAEQRPQHETTNKRFHVRPKQQRCLTAVP